MESQYILPLVTRGGNCMQEACLERIEIDRNLNSRPPVFRFPDELSSKPNRQDDRRQRNSRLTPSSWLVRRNIHDRDDGAVDFVFECAVRKHFKLIVDAQFVRKLFLHRK